MITFVFFHQVVLPLISFYKNGYVSRQNHPNSTNTVNRPTIVDVSFVRVAYTIMVVLNKDFLAVDAWSEFINFTRVTTLKINWGTINVNIVVSQFTTKQVTVAYVNGLKERPQRYLIKMKWTVVTTMAESNATKVLNRTTLLNRPI